MSLLLKNARVIDPCSNTDAVLDIKIKNNLISEIGVGLDSRGFKVIDLSGLWLTPGLIDMHTHLRDPGQTHKEDIESGTLAAQAGGYTSVCCMANTMPVVDTPLIVQYIVNKAKEKAKANVFPIASVTKNMEGQELTNMAQLIEAGAIAFSDDGRPIVNTRVYKNALLYLSMFNIPVISHPEDIYLSENGIMNESLSSTVSGIPSIPDVSESISIAREIELARYTGGRIHFAHVTSKRSIELIRMAKNDGLNITCETAPHYFCLSDRNLLSYKTDYKVNPPLRTDEDIEAVIEGLADGTIDVIATDHAPHHSDEKALDLLQAPFGIVGLETSLGLILTYLYHSRRIQPLKVMEKLTINPSKILNLSLGRINVGLKADLTIIDPDLEWIVSPKKFLSKAVNTPFEGFKLRGKSVATVRNGIYTANSDLSRYKQLKHSSSNNLEDFESKELSYISD